MKGKVKSGSRTYIDGIQQNRVTKGTYLKSYKIKDYSTFITWTTIIEHNDITDLGINDEDYDSPHINPNVKDDDLPHIGIN